MLANLAGLVITCVILVAFIKGLRSGVAALIVLRPTCDRIFEAAQFHFGGHSMTYGAILNAIVIGAAVISLPRVRSRIPPKLFAMWPAFLLIAFVATLYSPVRADAFRKFLTYMTCWSMFVFAFVLVRSRLDVRRFLHLVLTSSIVPVAYGLFQALTRHDLYSGTRVNSTFSHPNIFAFFLMLNIAVVLFLHATKSTRPGKSYLSALTLYAMPLFFLLVMTQTRSAWVATLVLLLIYGVAYDKRVLVFTLGLPPIMILAVPEIRARLVNLMSGNNYVGWVQEVNAYAWRNLLWQDAWPWIEKRFLFGYGLYSFPHYSPEFFPLEQARGVDAHNVFVQLLFETGIVGLFCYIWIFLRGLSWVALYGKYDRPGVALTMGIIVSYLVVCWSDNLLEYISFNWEFWFTIGLLFAHFATYRLRLRAFERLREYGPGLGLEHDVAISVRHA